MQVLDATYSATRLCWFPVIYAFWQRCSDREQTWNHNLPGVQRQSMAQQIKYKILPWIQCEERFLYLKGNMLSFQSRRHLPMNICLFIFIKSSFSVTYNVIYDLKEHCVAWKINRWIFFYSFQQHLQNLLPPHDRNWTGQQVLTYDPNLSLILIKSFWVLQTAYLIMRNLHKYLSSAGVTNSSIFLQKKTGESRVYQLNYILYLHVVLA